MASDNLAIVKQGYDYFAAGDIPSFLSLLADDVEWREAENNKLADGNPYKGPQAVLEGVFKRLAEDFDDFTLQIDRLIDGGDTIAMEGRYRAVAKATGMRIDPQVVHVFTLANGKVTSFQQHVDTLQLARALGEL